MRRARRASPESTGSLAEATVWISPPPSICRGRPGRTRPPVGRGGRHRTADPAGWQPWRGRSATGDEDAAVGLAPCPGHPGVVVAVRRQHGSSAALGLDAIEEHRKRSLPGSASKMVTGPHCSRQAANVAAMGRLLVPRVGGKDGDDLSRRGRGGCVDGVVDLGGERARNREGEARVDLANSSSIRRRSISRITASWAARTVMERRWPVRIAGSPTIVPGPSRRVTWCAIWRRRAGRSARRRPNQSGRPS